MKIFISLLLAFSSYLIIVNQVHAASISLGVFPPIIQINATPPADAQSPLSIENHSDQELHVKIDFKPFVASDQEDGQIKYIDQKDANFADPLIFDRVKIYDGDLETSEFDLTPGQKKDLSLRVTVPKGSPQADYYFSIVFLSSPKDFGGQSASQNLTGIASNVLLSIGQGEITGNVQEFSVPLFVENAPVPFTVRIKNTSNHFITPKGEIVISNIFGQKVGIINLLEANVLAQSVRSIPSSEFANEDNASLAPQDGTFAYWSDKFVLGPYKATLNLALSDKGPVYSQTILFFAFPFKLAIGLIISILLLIYIIARVKSRT